jgi:deazaflavin-dependent oxidoreductase (nitroreductase family)
VLDGLDPTAAATVLRMVPAPVRLLHRMVLRRRYERLAEPIRAVRARDGAVSARQRRFMVSVNRAVNTVVIALRPRRFRGAPLLMLTTIGRHSGEPRTTPLIYLQDGDRWIVVASNGGSDWEPGWWLNLRAGSPASVRIGDRTFPVTGREVEEPERGAVWTRLLEETFDYTAYQATVRRRLAVVTLEPIPGD